MRGQRVRQRGRAYILREDGESLKLRSPATVSSSRATAFQPSVEQDAPNPDTDVIRSTYGTVAFQPEEKASYDEAGRVISGKARIELNMADWTFIKNAYVIETSDGSRYRIDSFGQSEGRDAIIVMASAISVA